MSPSSSACAELAAIETYPSLLHTVASPEATEERVVNDRGQAPDGHDHVGNGSLTRQAGANGSEPGLEELVESWRRRANGVPQEDEAEPHIARGRAEVPGGAFHADPADVTPVTPVPVTPNPPIPQQPGPADPPPAAPS